VLALCISSCYLLLDYCFSCCMYRSSVFVSPMQFHTLHMYHGHLQTSAFVNHCPVYLINAITACRKRASIKRASIDRQTLCWGVCQAAKAIIGLIIRVRRFHQ